MRFGVPKQDRVHFCVSGHFVGPKYFQTSKFSGIGASSKVVRKLRDGHTDARTRNPGKSEYEEAPLASFRS